jgi:Domain of unknown function (DUF4157)
LSDHTSILSQSPATAPAAAKDVMPVQEQLQAELEVQPFKRTPIQFKHAIGPPDDPLKNEADAMADTIMRMPEQNFIQRKCADCEEEEKLQRKPLVSFIQRKEASSGAVVSDIISSQINSSRGNGSSMDNSTQTFMQSRFGADFSNVKIHTGGEAVQMNRELNAKAFTVGNDIYFNEGQYNPNSNDGKHLLAHELTHTVQQGGATTDLVNRRINNTTPRVIYRQLIPGPVDPTFTIAGTPNVTATPDGTEVNTPNQVNLFLGSFVMNARVQVQASVPTTLNDWEVGVVQMVSGAVDATCYQRPALRTGRTSSLRTFVERMTTQSQMFHPDRSPASTVFYDPGSMADLATYSSGTGSFVVSLHAEDHPGYRSVRGAASAHTHDLGDTDVELKHHRHLGFFYTYIVARQKSTERLIPLYTMRWWAASDYGYFSPGTGIDFTATNRSSLQFHLISSNVFSHSDFFPIVRGPTMGERSRLRSQEWRDGECPGFVELGGGQ